MWLEADYEPHHIEGDEAGGDGDLRIDVEHDALKRHRLHPRNQVLLPPHPRRKTV